MPTYTYTTTSAPGELQLVADNLPAAVCSLRDAGVIPVRIGEPTPDLAGDGHVGEADLCIFVRQLASLLENGTPMVEALRLLAEESRSAGVCRAAAGLADDVAEGIPLSGAMSRRPRAFGPLIAGLVQAGEVGGNLEETLNEIADQREGLSRIARQSAGMLVYPFLVAVVGLGIVSFLITFILPKFVELFRELGIQEFPLPTLIMLSVSHYLPVFFVALIVALLFLAVVWTVRRQTGRGRLVMDYWRLGAPIVGRINLNMALARVSSTLALLLRSGVPVLQALRLAGAAAGNGVIAGAFRRAERAVSEGRPLAEGLRETGVLPESFIARVGVGEVAGSLDDTLRRMASYYIDASMASARAIQSALEPLLVICLGFVVGVIVISMFLPLIAIVGSLSSS